MNDELTAQLLKAFEELGELRKAVDMLNQQQARLDSRLDRLWEKVAGPIPPNHKNPAKPVETGAIPPSPESSPTVPPTL